MIKKLAYSELNARIRNHECDSMKTDTFDNTFYVFKSEDIVICAFSDIEELYVVYTRHMSHLFEREWVLDDDDKTIVTLYYDSNGNEFKIPLEFFTDNF